MEYESDAPHPGILLNDQDATDALRIQYRSRRTNDPDLRLALERAVEDNANTPDEAEEGKRLVRQLMHATNRPMRPEDVPAILGAMRSGEDPREVLSRQASDREERRQPIMSPSQEDAELRQPQPYRPDKPRGEGFQTLADRTEAKIVAMGLDPEQERTLREILAEVRAQGPNSPGQVERYSRSMRNGMSKRSILARDGIY